MTSRERVQTVIDGGVPDRIPIYGWVRANLDGPISKAFGSCDAFEDHYEFDLAHLFGGPYPYPGLSARKADRPIEPAEALDLIMSDPDDTAAYAGIAAGIEHHKTRRGRFVYVQTPGIFECLNDVFGIENHLMYLGLEPDTLREIYGRQALWNRRFAMNCLDLGVDMVHVSDDWGGQTGLMFSPRTWRALIMPAHKVTCDAVKARGANLSLHTDGNINSVVEGIVELGFDVVHPWQESAGQSLTDHHARWRSHFAVMGGLDVQTTIGFGKLEFLRAEIERVMRIGADGGLLYCTSHFVQDHCSIEELTMAFDLIYDLSRRVTA